jgi:hypothetical protein
MNEPLTTDQILENSDIGAVNDTWKNQGQPVAMNGLSKLGIFVKMTVNSSTGNYIQVLTENGTTDYLLPVEDNYLKELGDATINLYYEFETNGLVPSVQIQSKATLVGATEAVLDIAITKL